jgi:ribosomal-protein-alanine N-acetyltransferase
MQHAPASERVYNPTVDFQLRDFRSEDFITLWDIDQQCFAPGIAYSREELETYIRRKDAFTLVVEATRTNGQKAGAIVGFLVAEARRDTGHILTIDVLPSARQVGVGSKLLSAAEDKLRNGGCRYVYLETAVDNQIALVFYKRQGYFLEKVVPHYYANGVDALILQKDLQQKDLLSPARAS